jgi:hypothetical protein
MSCIPFSEDRSHLTEVVNNINYKGKSFILTKNRKLVADFVSIETI